MMNKQTKYWVTFLAPGSFTAETWSKDYADKIRPENIEFPDNAYAFTIHQRVDVADGGSTYKRDAKQLGPVYYHKDSTIESLDEVRKNPNAGDILVRNMESNRRDKVVWTRWGNWPQPFLEGMQVILEA